MYHAPFVVENVEYKTTEHFFQAAKARHFKDNDTLRKIIDCDDPVKVKFLGKQVKHFDRKEWDVLKEETMKIGNAHKYQNPALQEKLLATGNRHLAECVPRDCFWGIGIGKAKAELNNGNYPGKNIMGHILEEVRQHFQDKIEHDQARKQVLGG
ncbi:hypothetical protein COCSADRAFT_96527 [Bipolaris sorokiniana ND90Pr]|uniref:NADAR domain-containing protein n=1 Tax=Cochliobolus sativus (strain ND90Pr / ATCC 201652) TaxID=665912 RepID=M2S357_COCSN|nr:uncharacterized protein COCSADRAFT_96527 [Bipolaris sorokiniana ND90Pr]EMD61598.1 hypothetical protein COCSADRAFT_96527 [Bipolaris sorokiniana ND90Pr]